MAMEAELKVYSRSGTLRAGWSVRVRVETSSVVSQNPDEVRAGVATRFDQVRDSLCASGVVVR